MSKSSLLKRQLTLFYKTDHFTLGKKTLPEIKSIISKRLYKKHSCNLHSFYTMKISQILNKKSYPNSIYREFLLLIDEGEFLSYYYNHKEYYHNLAYLITIYTQFVKEFPNYLPHGTIYQIMLLNLVQKQKIINNFNARMIDVYRSTKGEIYKDIFTCDLIEDDTYSFEDHNGNGFFKNVTKDDSIDSVEHLTKYVDNIEKGIKNDPDGMTPLRKKLNYQGKRRSSLLSILQRFSLHDIENTSRFIRESVEDEDTKRSKLDSSRWNRNNQNRMKTVAPIGNNKIAKLILSHKFRSKFVKTSVFIDKLRNSHIIFKKSDEDKKKDSRLFTEPNKKVKQINEHEKIGMFFASKKFFSNLKKESKEAMSLPHIIKNYDKNTIGATSRKGNEGSHHKNNSHFSKSSYCSPNKTITGNKNFSMFRNQLTDCKQIQMEPVRIALFTSSSQSQSQTDSKRESYDMQSITSYNNKKVHFF